MRFLKMILAASALLIGLQATATEICTLRDADGNCLIWWDTQDGDITPNYPGLPDNPANPGSNCYCTNYDGSNCIQYECWN